MFVGLRAVLPPLPALLLACALGVAGSLLAATWWRRGLIAIGFPLSAALTGAVALPAWAWLLPLALLLLVYPINAWRDAPLFPTPPGALRGLEAHAALADGAPVLDAGCGLGDGLKTPARGLPARSCMGWNGAGRWPCCAVCAALGQGAPRRYLGRGLECLCAGVSVPAPESMAAWPRRPAPKWLRNGWLGQPGVRLPGVRPSMRLQSFAGHGVWVYPPAIAANGGRRAGWRAVGRPINVVATQGKALIFLSLARGFRPQLRRSMTQQPKEFLHAPENQAPAGGRLRRDRADGLVKPPT